MNATAATKRPTGRSSAVIIERSAPAGSMAPLHRRNKPETYQVLEGRPTFYVAGDRIPARPGDMVVAPAGAERTVHAETAARWFVQTTVSSLERFADFGRAVAAPLPNSVRGWPSADELASADRDRRRQRHRDPRAARRAAAGVGLTQRPRRRR